MWAHLCVLVHAHEGKALWQGAGVCLSVCQEWKDERGSAGQTPVRRREQKWVSVRERASQAEISGFLCVCVLFQIGSLWLQQQIHTRQAGMREREELRRAIEQSERLLSKVRQLEEQNTQINKEKNEVATKYQAVSLLLCSAASLPFVSPSLFSVFPL